MKPSKLHQFPHLPFPWLPPPVLLLQSEPESIPDPNPYPKPDNDLELLRSLHHQRPEIHPQTDPLRLLLRLSPPQFPPHPRDIPSPNLSPLPPPPVTCCRRRPLPHEPPRRPSPGPTVLIPLIEAYSAAGRHADAAELFLRFPVSNEVFSYLFKTLVADGQLDVAESLFSKAADLGFQIQVRYYNALIKGYCDNLRVDDGIRVFKGMVSSGVSPDVITFSTLMGKEGRVLEANALFRNMLVNGVLPDVASHKILFRMYWRNRMVSDAVGVLRAMVFKGLLGEEEVLGLDGEVVREGILGAILKRGSMGFFVG